MRILDEITELNLYFVEQELPKVTFYEGYCGEVKLFQVKKNFDEAVKLWANEVSKYIQQQKVA